MLKSTRRRLFYALVAVFFVIGAGIVLYAEGWRFDLGHFRPEKVGEIYVHSYPMDAAVAVNGKTVEDQIGFLTRGTLVPDLLPGTYEVSLHETGYDAWQESAVVAPALVTEFKYAVLVPQTAGVFATTTVSAFSLTANGPAIQTPQGIVMNGERADIGTITSSASSLDGFIVQRPSGNAMLRDPMASTTLNLTNLFSANGITVRNATSISLDIYDQDIVAMADNSHINVINIPTQALIDTETPLSGAALIPALAFSPSGAAWGVWSPKKNISRVDFFDISQATSSQSSSTISGKIASISWIAGQSFAVLETNGELYDYNANSQIFTKRADDVTSIAVSSDGTMLAALEHAGIEVFDLNTSDYWRFNVPDMAAAQKLIWYHDDRHLFIVYPDHVSFLDLQDAQLLNVTTVARGTSPEYDTNANTLYLISPDGRLIDFVFPS